MKRLTSRDDDGKAQVLGINHRIAFEKLAQYEDAEEEGRLVRLPVKAGDTVYLIYPNSKEAYGMKVSKFILTSSYLQLLFSNGAVYTCWDGPDAYFGKYIFPT